MRNEISTVQCIMDEFPEASDQFVEIMVKAIALHEKKRHDYNGPNFVQEHNTFMTMGKFWDIKRKFDRLNNKMVEGIDYKVDESFEDTLLDLGNY